MLVSYTTLDPTDPHTEVLASVVDNLDLDLHLHILDIYIF